MLATLRPRRLAGLALGLTTLVTACRDDPAGPAGRGEAAARAYNADWTAATHGGDARPDYDVVFPQAAVNSLEITMTAAQWARVRANVTGLLGSDFGAPAAGRPAVGSGARDPAYVDVTVRFNGRTWRNVGFRLKGNGSLSGAWRQGNYKLPFRLQFDEFEDQIPAIDDQRFHGFKELSMAPGWSDNSLIREKLAADVFRLAGVPAARTAFYRVTIDFGAGPRYCGVYTMLEVIDDTMVEDQFGDDDGNVYKPESDLRTFVQAQFEKKNNVAAADYADVRAFVAALNGALRTTDPARWRAGLEATFDVDHFLRRLAVNNAIVNWDGYGALAHNYYLYHHPTRHLVWIPWDHNLAMIGNPGVTGTPAPTPPPGGVPASVGPVSLSMNEVGAAWPLLRHLADDPVYFARYRAHLKTFNETVFTESAMDALIDRYAALIAPHVVGAGGEQPGYSHLASPAAFTSEVAALKAHVRARRALVASFVP